jgi:hypothetical protein
MNGETPTQARDALFQQTFLADVVTNPANKLLLDAKKNDLLTGWNPKAPTLLCGGAGDPTVPPSVHMTPTAYAFNNSPTRVATVATVDVDAQIQAAFGGTGGAAVGTPTYVANYHGTYEPPFCLVAARNAFDLVK